MASTKAITGFSYKNRMKGPVMISPEFNFAKFIHTVEDKHREEILKLTNYELIEAENAIKKRGYGQEYIRALKGLLFFIGPGGIKPSGVDEDDFQLFRPICEKLVAKKQSKPSILKAFESDK
jgi:hypothetical protein